MNRQSAEWMKREDERILEFLATEDMAPATLIANEVFRTVSAGHVSERLAKLEHAGLVHRAGMDSFDLTSEGERYHTLDSGGQGSLRCRTPSRSRLERGRHSSGRWETCRSRWRVSTREPPQFCTVNFARRRGPPTGYQFKSGFSPRFRKSISQIRGTEDSANSRLAVHCNSGGK